MDRMKEILYYHKDNARHCDGSGLFNLHYNLPEDGTAFIAHNLVNAPMNEDGTHGYEDSDYGKDFCITTLPQNIHTCANERGHAPYYHHISNIHQGDVILMAFDAVRLRLKTVITGKQH